ncbi:MAG: hypothetical protein A2W26_03610 [Acidobacteria bacterium RBG_16_64_8]|nr:MAG: hypothetical protein A2W26_03610 [Acidobacteria bacterium RBG_16_64_8]
MIFYARHEITPDDEAAVLHVLRSERLTQGPEVEAFEADLCAVTGARYAVCVASGTVALELAYAAIGGPVEFHCPTVTFMATVNAAQWVGERTHFYDNTLGDNTLGYTPSGLVVTVSLGGDVRECGIIHDAAHSLGATPTLLPGMTLCATLSFHPAKHVACGEGGAVLTESPDLARRIHMYRDHGCTIEDGHRTQQVLGTNGRMSELAAALGRSQLRRLAENVARRREISALYDDAFGPIAVPHGPGSARHLYQIRVPADVRDTVRQKLAADGVGTQVHYPCVHLQPYWGYPVGTFPHAERYAAEVISLPLYPTLTHAEIDHVRRSVLQHLDG